MQSQPQITMIPLGSLTPSTTHIQELRRARFDPKLIEELADSMKSAGQLQPILVRRSQANGRADRFEIVAGERRFLAAKKAGLAEIQATVRDLSDELVLEVQLIENLQREGLHELEEAEGYEELMKLKKISADDVADMVGRSRSYVFKRTKLLALCPEARQAFYGGALDASKALLIARIGHHDTQREALKMVTKGRYPGDGPMNYRDAHKFILENFMLKLAGAPFDIKDEQLLPKAGSCSKCPKRTGNVRDLFGDVKDVDVCTDPKCFTEKRDAALTAEVRALEAKGKKVIAGAEAKKIFPEWESENKWARDRMERGYKSLSETMWVGNNSHKVSAVVGDDYDPVLVQHPGTGQLVKVATPEAIDAGSRRMQRTKKKAKKGTASAAKKQDPLHDEVQELLGGRVLKAVAEKASGKLGRLELSVLVEQLWDSLTNVCIDMRTQDVAKAMGWGKAKSGWNAPLPAEAKKLSEKDAARFIVVALGCLALEGVSEAEPILKALKVDKKAIEKEIRAELKKAEDEKAAKANPAKKKG